jgi:hypothetical protein
MIFVLRRTSLLPFKLRTAVIACRVFGRGVSSVKSPATDGAFSVDTETGEGGCEIIGIIVFERVLLVLVRGLRLDGILVLREVFRNEARMIASYILCISSYSDRVETGDR